jgi:hypothetical protein
VATVSSEKKWLGGLREDLTRRSLLSARKKKKKKENQRERGASRVGWLGWAVALLGPGRGPVGLSFSFFVLSFILFCFVICLVTFTF